MPRLVCAPCLRRAYANVGYSLCLTPGLLQTYTTIDSGASKGVWFKAGAMIFESYVWICMGAPALVSAQSILAELASQVVMMGAIEAQRVNGGPFGGRDLDLVYPSGKQFDPLSLADDPDTAAELEVKENKKGRLAMLSLFGCYVQVAVTRPQSLRASTWVASPSSISSCAHACCFVSWLLQCCTPRSCACVLQCCSSAMP